MTTIPTSFSTRALRALVLAIAAVVAGAVDAAAFQIHGTVTNGTTGKPLHPATVQVVDASVGMSVAQEVQVQDGGFTIDGLSERSVYLLRVRHQGINYTEMARYDGQDAQHVEINVYEPTTSWQDVTVSIPHVLVSRSGDTLTVQKFIQVSNESSPPATVRSDDNPFVIYMPEDHIEVQTVHVMSLGVPLSMTPKPTGEPGFYEIDYPFKPGVTPVNVVYSLPYENSRYHYEERSKYDVEEMLIITEDPTLEIASETIQVERVEDFHGFKGYRLAGLTPDRPLDFTLSGGSGTPPAAGRMRGASPQVFVVPNGARNLSIALMGLVIVVLVGLLGFAAGKPLSRSTQGQVLQAQKDELLNQLARLDDLHRTGTVSDAIYKIKRDELTNALAHIYYRMEFESPAATRPVRDPEGAARV